MIIHKKRIAVVGVGTAGITSLSHLLAWLPADLEVYSIHDPSTPILGIGESTTVAIPANLYLGTRFTMLRDAAQLDASIKNGVKYVGWRDYDFYSHIPPPSHGIHFNNFKLKDFSFARFKEIWGDKFVEIHAKINDIITDQNDCAVVVTDTERLEFDFVIDCRGYPTDYTEYHISNVIPVNHCLVNMIPKPGDWPWTYHTAHRNGWMFGIPLQSRQGWGYLYNDNITAREDAVDDLAERFKTPANELQLREFSFKNYFAKEFIVGKVMKNGNRALFFEPIEAMSGYFYDQVMKHFFDVLLGVNDAASTNTELTRIAEDLETFIAYMYQGGSTYDTEFWKITKEKCSKHVRENQRFNWYMDLLKDASSMRDRSDLKLYGTWNSTNWVDFDKNLGYHYITSPSELKSW
jgi:hypothetical protein